MSIMSVNTKEFIKNVNNHLNGNVIILGGWSKFYDGYYSSYEKKWVDVAITPESVDLISELGVPLEINGGHSWGKTIVNQFIVMCGERKKRNFLDVFVTNNMPEYKTIDGLKIQTPQAGINFHQKVYEDLNEDWVLQKIQKLKTLYSL